MDDVLVHDLKKGIPAPDGSVDAVYHSHLLEHVDRDAVPAFLAEIWRVLRPGGVHRVVVPDLERYAGDYLDSLERGLGDPQARGWHDAKVSQMILQMVRREAWGTSKQGACSASARKPSARRRSKAGGNAHVDVGSRELTGRARARAPS